MMLDVRDLKVYFYTRGGVVKAVDGITFGMREGETLGIVGESGCGKTTTGMAIMNMVSRPGRIAGGSISLDGREISSLSESTMRREIRWKKVSMVFQGAMNCLTPTYTIGKQMVETIVYHTGMDEKEAVEIAKKYLAHVGLKEDVIKRYPHELSGGMKQRAGLARALAAEPDILLMDEPFASLDALSREEMQEELFNIWAEERKTFVLVTHSVDEALYLSDRIVILTKRPARIKRIFENSGKKRRESPEMKKDIMAVLREEMA